MATIRRGYRSNAPFKHWSSQSPHDDLARLQGALNAGTMIHARVSVMFCRWPPHAHHYCEVDRLKLKD